MKKPVSLKATAIRFSIEEKSIKKDIVLEGNLADFFINVVIASGLSKTDILLALYDLLKSKDTKLIKTNKNEIVLRGNYMTPFKRPCPSNKSAVEINNKQ
jgi:hypothetical protein